jgi:hypothetical protein
LSLSVSVCLCLSLSLSSETRPQEELTPQRVLGSTAPVTHNRGPLAASTTTNQPNQVDGHQRQNRTPRNTRARGDIPFGGVHANGLAVGAGCAQEAREEVLVLLLGVEPVAGPADSAIGERECVQSTGTAGLFAPSMSSQIMP